MMIPFRDAEGSLNWITQEEYDRIMRLKFELNERMMKQIRKDGPIRGTIHITSTPADGFDSDDMRNLWNDTPWNK